MGVAADHARGCGERLGELGEGALHSGQSKCLLERVGRAGERGMRRPGLGPRKQRGSMQDMGGPPCWRLITSAPAAPSPFLRVLRRAPASQPGAGWRRRHGGVMPGRWGSSRPATARPVGATSLLGPGDGRGRVGSPHARAKAGLQAGCSSLPGPSWAAHCCPVATGAAIGAPPAGTARPWRWAAGRP